MRGLRAILGLPSTFVDRTCTDAYLLCKANQQIREEGKQTDYIKMIDENLRQTQTNLFGHLIRQTTYDPQNPMTEVIFDSKLRTTNPITYRVGKPRVHWIEQNFRTCFCLLVWRPSVNASDGWFCCGCCCRGCCCSCCG